jgi:hypothetical protein
VSDHAGNRQLVIARTLRRFGLVDQFGFDALIQRGVPLTPRRIEHLLTDSGVMLPPGTSAKYIAAQLAAELNEQNVKAADTTITRMVADLPLIPPGAKTAGKYHDAILKIFPALFESRLGKIRKELSIFDKTKRIDLKAENNQPQGFFSELRSRYELYCPYVFFECKNYAEDVANREFDQLFGRLGRESTQVGAIVCRQVTDHAKVLAAVKQPYHTIDRKLAIVITDDLLCEIATARQTSGAPAVDEILQREYERVLL